MNSDEQDEEADAIVARVLERYKEAPAIEKPGTTRAVVVVDENVDFLAGPLQEANFRVVTSREGLADFEIRLALLGQRILVTKNTGDFLDDAPVHDYGIIGLDALPVVDSAKAYKDNKTVQMISKAVSDYSLVTERAGYVLMLKPNGKHVFRRLG